MHHLIRAITLLGVLALLPLPLHATDADGDGMDDAWETSMGLNPTDPLDAFTDLDGDRVPNLWEYARGTAANNASSVPTLDATVDSTLPTNGSLKRYNTLQEAYNALPTTAGYRAVVSVLHGRHDASLYDSSVAKKVAWIGQSGSDRMKGFEGPVLATIGMFGYGLTLTDETVLDNIIIEGSGDLVRDAPAIQVRPVSGTPRIRLVNCIVRDWISADIFYGYLGAIVNDGGNLSLVHSTICESTGMDYWWGDDQCIVENVSGSLHLINSILWDGGTTASNALMGTAPSTVVSSIVQGGVTGGVDTDPELTKGGYIADENSYCLGNGTYVGLATDINDETRGTSPTDIGADHLHLTLEGLPHWWVNFWFGGGTPTQSENPDGDAYTNIQEYYLNEPPVVDQDGDGLTDTWEVYYFGKIYAQDGSGNPDADGRTNLQEEAAGTDPTQMDLDYDSDSDGLMDWWEIVYFGNITAQNGSGNPDKDGRTNLQEQAAGTNPLEKDWDWDGDGDGLPYGWEMYYFGNTTSQNGSGDPDFDGISNLDEYLGSTNPLVMEAELDTDGDGFLDSLEMFWFGNLNQTLYTDFDGDGLTDAAETRYSHSNPTLADSNGDGLLDGPAFFGGFSVTGTDTDGDGLDNATELLMGTNPLLADTDGDGVPDDLDYYPLDPAYSTQQTPSTGVTITLLSPPATPL